MCDLWFGQRDYNIIGAFKQTNILWEHREKLLRHSMRLHLPMNSCCSLLIWEPANTEAEAEAGTNGCIYCIDSWSCSAFFATVEHSWIARAAGEALRRGPMCCFEWSDNWLHLVVLLNRLAVEARARKAEAGQRLLSERNDEVLLSESLCLVSSL